MLLGKMVKLLKSKTGDEELDNAISEAAATTFLRVVMKSDTASVKDVRFLVVNPADGVSSDEGEPNTMSVSYLKLMSDGSPVMVATYVTCLSEEQEEYLRQKMVALDDEAEKQVGVE